MNSENQVDLSSLLFGMSWEDPASDQKALAIQPGDTVTTISSGGCNTLTLLLENPGKVYAVDINASQSYLLELKCAALRHLEFDELRAFLGLTPSNDRLRMFEQLQTELTDAARIYWTGRTEEVQRGIVYTGRYESFIRLFRKLLTFLQGRKRVEGLFLCDSLEKQKVYFDEVWNTSQWRLLFKLAFNKRILAKRGLTADYFKFDDGASSFADSFFQRTRHAMRDIPMSSNYFLAQYLLGRYLSEDAVPAYLRRSNLPIVKSRLDRIEIVTSDAQGWLGRQPSSSIDAFSLSNICELMSPEETSRLFAEVTRCARPGARICFRNLIVPRSVPESLQREIELQEELSRDLITFDRSFVYSRVQAFVVKHRSLPDSQ